jgi:hypothetical protein
MARSGIPARRLAISVTRQDSRYSRIVGIFVGKPVGYSSRQRRTLQQNGEP